MSVPEVHWQNKVLNPGFQLPDLVGRAGKVLDLANFQNIKLETVEAVGTTKDQLAFIAFFTREPHFQGPFIAFFCVSGTKSKLALELITAEWELQHGL